MLTYLPLFTVRSWARRVEVKVVHVRVDKVRVILLILDLPAPPLYEVLQHVKRSGSLDLRVDIVPRLARPVLGVDRKACLIEVTRMGGLERGEEGVLLIVPPPARHIQPAHEGDDAPLASVVILLGNFCIHCDGLLMVRVTRGCPLPVQDGRESLLSGYQRYTNLTPSTRQCMNRDQIKI